VTNIRKKITFFFKFKIYTAEFMRYLIIIIIAQYLLKTLYKN